MNQNANLTLLKERLKHHISKARETAGIDEKTEIELR